MKKYFLMSLIAAFVMVLNVNAQDNTYNMVVKMANGTEVTIGPNDIDNILFNEGEIVVSGTRLNDLLKKLADVRVWTIGDDGYWYADGMKTDYSAIGPKGDMGEMGYPGKDGMDGKPGSVVTLSSGGYLVIDGQPTHIFDGTLERIEALKTYTEELEKKIIYLEEQNVKRVKETHILLDILKSKGIIPEDQNPFGD